jgi:hypothetical protein
MTARCYMKSCGDEALQRLQSVITIAQNIRYGDFGLAT